MLQIGLNIVFDGQWGSSGKGKICAYLAATRRPDIVSACNGPNAGHTVVDDDGTKRVYKCLPSGSMYCDRILLGAGAVLSEKQLAIEKSWLSDSALVFVHPRAVRLTSEHVEREAELVSIASTRQGAGAALADKIMRRDVLWGGQSNQWDEFRKTESVWLHEVAQGFALSLDHGSHYPNCTSRNCTPQAALDSLGLPTKKLKSSMMVIRPFPIRVGNDGENSSGGWYEDQQETTWQQIAMDSGLPESRFAELLAREHTTVTKRQRRVSTLSWIGLRAAVSVCAPDSIALNFAQYVDAKAEGVRERSKLPIRVMKLIMEIEDKLGVPVLLVGTGAKTFDMVEM